MEFFDFEPAFEFYRRQGATFNREEFARKVERQLRARHFSREQESLELLRFRSERVWAELASPYFKIWPEVIPLLTNVGIDIPAECLRLPFAVFLLRLPRAGLALKIDEQFQVRTILVTEIRNETFRMINLWIDIGETESTGLPMLYWHRLRCDSHLTIENALASNKGRDLPGAQIPDDLVRQCLQLAVSTCFLSTGMDRLIEPDILSKDLSAYIDAKRRNDNAQIQRIEERAARRKGPGWNVGGPDRLRTLITPSRQSGDVAETGRELVHQHQRRAHFRLLGSGAVVFVRQATIRPDLPPPNSRSAYAVR